MLPRGIRNNNPLNIRVGNAWLGEVAEPTDKEFEQFVSLTYGLRAAFILLRRYIQRYKLNTIEAILRRWSPPTENHTENYIEKVCELTRLSRWEEIDFNNEETMLAIVDAMIMVENGESVPVSCIEHAYRKVKYASGNLIK